MYLNLIENQVHCLQFALNKNDYKRMCILKDAFQICVSVQFLKIATFINEH